MTRVINIKAGRLLQFSEGEYSDYGIGGTFVALRDLTTGDIADCASIAAMNRYAGYKPSDAAKSGVKAELIRQGFLLEVDCEEIHLGSFGEISEEFGVYPDGLWEDAK